MGFRGTIGSTSEAYKRTKALTEADLDRKLASLSSFVDEYAGKHEDSSRARLAATYLMSVATRVRPLVAQYHQKHAQLIKKMDADRRYESQIAREEDATRQNVRRSTDWIEIAIQGVAKKCSIGLSATCDRSTLGKGPHELDCPTGSGEFELAVRLLANKTEKLPFQKTMHHTRLSLAILDSQGECLAWTSEPLPVTFYSYGGDARDPITLKERAKLKALLKTTKAPKKKQPPSLLPANIRSILLKKFTEESKKGVHFEHLHFGKAVSSKKLDRIEANVLGGLMDPALREFFEQMDGMQCFYWLDPLAPIVAKQQPTPRRKGVLAWDESSGDSPLWEQVRTMVGAWSAADCPPRSDGEEIRVGHLNIPSVDTMFGTAWRDVLGFDENEYLFSALGIGAGQILSQQSDAAGAHQSQLMNSGDHFADRQLDTVISVREALTTYIESGCALPDHYFVYL